MFQLFLVRHEKVPVDGQNLGLLYIKGQRIYGEMVPYNLCHNKKAVYPL